MNGRLVVYRCGAEAELLWPEGDPEGLERKCREVAGRVCPFCAGDDRREGAELFVGDGRLDLWRWHDVTPEEEQA